MTFVLESRTGWRHGNAGRAHLAGPCALRDIRAGRLAVRAGQPAAHASQRGADSAAVLASAAATRAARRRPARAHARREAVPRGEALRAQVGGQGGSTQLGRVRRSRCAAVSFAAAAAAPRRAVPTAAARVAGAPLLAPGGAVARGPCAGAPRLCCSPPREARRGLPAMPGQPLRALPLPALPLPPSLSLPVSGSQDLTLRRVEHRGAAAAPGLHGRRTRPPAARSPAGAARGPEQNPGWPQGLSHSALRAHWPPAPTA